ncbi:putative Xaa-Pro aminopeptidase [Podosphaera aphanis]|nr:putative Xaa-Pro aminopeptidase [Podosphaera aphanis]
MADLDLLLAAKYPAKPHAQCVVSWMRKRNPDVCGIVYVEGLITQIIEDCDQEAPFRQRRSFFYLTGCDLPNCYFTYDIETDKSILFIPPIDPAIVIWSGLPISPAEALSLYDVDEVRTTDQVNEYFTRTKSHTAIWTIKNQVSDHVKFPILGDRDFSLLREAIEECRVVKDEYEIALIKKANMISAVAHHAVQKSIKSKQNEQELEALFLERCKSFGAREQAYSPIFASGTAAATLHYVKNNAKLGGNLNLLVDAGAEYRCYASDITRTLPINGKFSPESKAIYEIVLQMQQECIEMLKEGVVWDEVHLRAHEIAIQGLLRIGILQGDKGAIFSARTSVAFFPHGLGHYLGMDTHDTGGHPNYNDRDPIFRYLRVRGRLPAGSIITVEPGIYFCRFIVEPYLKDPTHSDFINTDVLSKYWEVGGVRIEDNILITATGYQNLTTVEKSIEKMESLINTCSS